MGILGVSFFYDIFDVIFHLRDQKEEKISEPAYILSSGPKEIKLNDVTSAVSSAVPIGVKNTVPILTDLAEAVFKESHGGQDFLQAIGRKLYRRDVQLELRIINDLYGRRKELSTDMVGPERPIIYFDSSLTPAQYFGHFF